LSEIKHTPGPWKTFQRLSTDLLPEIVVTAENGCPLAVVSNHAEFKDTARLIAVAPDLLAQLKSIVADHDEYGSVALSSIGHARAIIANAEGRSDAL
jgi:hypothetical protein